MANQTTSEILMIRPAIAMANPETSSSNAFQADQAGANALDLIHSEFDSAVETLSKAGVTVHTFQDTLNPQTPDAVFPNNWFSTHEGSTLVLYPMLAENRAAEVKPAPLDFLRSRYANQIDIRNLPPLEGTGSLVLDRINHHAFVARSPRSSNETLARWAQALEYGFTMFSAKDKQGQDIYHTNVMMAIGCTWAAIVNECLTNPDDQLDIYEQLESREIIELTMTQLYAFAGNMLELKSDTDEPKIVLSQSAFQCLNRTQIQQLSKHGELLPIAIPTIEQLGGGSIRCMIAELF
ncbi:MAG: arginine deiminase-related protein [Fimbriimonadaceae bacterium]